MIHHAIQCRALVSNGNEHSGSVKVEGLSENWRGYKLFM
jgi:hypothetical protein